MRLIAITLIDPYLEQSISQNGCGIQKKAPTEAGAQIAEKLSMAASRHSGSFTFVCIDRDQKRVPIGIGELVSLHVGTVVE